MQCLQAQLMLEMAHVVCNSIVEQAGVVVWRKMTAWPLNTLLYKQKVHLTVVKCVEKAAV